MIDDFRGIGWAFPVQLGPRLAVSAPATESLPQPPAPPDPRGQIAVSRGDRAVRESILLIVGTARGERLMRPDFGCGIHELVFGPDDPVTAARVSHEIREALIEWEPRADVLSVDVTSDPAQEGVLTIALEYRVRSTNNVFNLVYPFHLDGTEAGA